MLSIGTGLPSLPPATLPSPTNSKTLPSLPPATLPSQSQPSVGLPAREGSGRPWRHAIKSRSPSPQPEVHAAMPVHAAPVRRARSPSPLQLVPSHTVQRSQSPPQRVRIRSPQTSLQAASRPGTPAAAKPPCREQSVEDLSSTNTPSLRSFPEQKKLPPPPQLLQAVTGSGAEMGPTLQAGIATGIGQVTWSSMSNGLSASKAGLLQAAHAPTAISGSGGAGAAWAFPGGPAAASEAAVRQLRREVEELRTELRQVKAALQDGEQRKEQEEQHGSTTCNGSSAPEGECKLNTNGHAVEKVGQCERGADCPTKLRAASLSEPHPFMQVDPFSSAAYLSKSRPACTGDTTVAAVEPASVTLCYPGSNSSSAPGASCIDAIKWGSRFPLEVRAKNDAILKKVQDDHCRRARESKDVNIDRKLRDADVPRRQAAEESTVDSKLQEQSCSQVQADAHSNGNGKPCDYHEDDPQIHCGQALPISSCKNVTESKHASQLPIANGMCGSICLDDELCNSHCDDATVSLSDLPKGSCTPTLSALGMLGRGHPPEMSEGVQASTGTPGLHWHQHDVDVEDEPNGGFGEVPDLDTGASCECPSVIIATVNADHGERGVSENCNGKTCKEAIGVESEACEETFGFKSSAAADKLDREEVEADDFGVHQRVDINDELGSTQVRIDTVLKDDLLRDELGSTQVRIDTVLKDKAQRDVASPAWGTARACRVPEASPSPTDNEDDFLSPSKDGSGSYILVSPSTCERSYIISKSQYGGKNGPSGSNVFSPIRMQGDSSPTLSPSPSRLMPGYLSGSPDGQGSGIAQGPAAVAAAVFAATSRDEPSHSEALPSVRAQRLPSAPVSISLATAQLVGGAHVEAGLDPWDSQELDSSRSGFGAKAIGDSCSVDSRSYHVSASASLAASLSESQSSFQTLMPMPLPPPPVPCFGLTFTAPQSGGDSRSLPRRYRSAGASRAGSCSSSTSSHLRCASPAASSTRASRTQTPSGCGEERSASSQPLASKYFTVPPPRESFCVPPVPPAETPSWPGQEQHKWLPDAPSDSQGSALYSQGSALYSQGSALYSQGSALYSQGSALYSQGSGLSSCMGSLVAPNALMLPAASYAEDVPTDSAAKEERKGSARVLPQVPLRYPLTSSRRSAELTCKGILVRGSSSSAPTATAVVPLPKPNPNRRTLPGAPPRGLSPGPLRSSSPLRASSGAKTPPRNVWTRTTAATAKSRAEAVTGAQACPDLRSASMARSVSPPREAPIAAFCAVTLPRASTPQRSPSSSIFSRPPPT